MIIDFGENLYGGRNHGATLEIIRNFGKIVSEKVRESVKFTIEF